MLRIKQSNLEDVFRKNRKIVLFGAGSVTKIMFEAYKKLAFEEKVDYIIDNNKSRDGEIIQINDKAIRIVSIEHFIDLGYASYALIIMPVFMLDIVKQLDSLKEFDEVPCYIYPFLMNRDNDKKFLIKHFKEMKIPKTIHYCWFGRNPFPDKYKRNIESCKKYCPDYEIVEWNETNYDVKKNRFMRQAYEKRKWEYVSDYARKDIIFQYGGVYFDTDVEFIKPIDDLLFHDFFIGCDDVANIASGAGFGAVKGNALMKEFRDDYDNHIFVDNAGSIVGKVCGIYESLFFVKYGYKPNNKLQILNNGGVIFPREVLCPISWIGMPDIYTENTLTAHKYDDLLIDNKGKENAPAQRREIEMLIERMKRGEAEI